MFIVSLLIQLTIPHHRYHWTVGGCQKIALWSRPKLFTAPPTNAKRLLEIYSKVCGWWSTVANVLGRDQITAVFCHSLTVRWYPASVKLKIHFSLFLYKFITFHKSYISLNTSNFHFEIPLFWLALHKKKHQSYLFRHLYFLLRWQCYYRHISGVEEVALLTWKTCVTVNQRLFHRSCKLY